MIFIIESVGQTYLKQTRGESRNYDIVIKFLFLRSIDTRNIVNKLRKHIPQI